MHILAAADVGSTSVHLLVARATASGRETMLDTSAFLELGAALEARGTIGRGKTAELLEALRDQVVHARRLEAETITVVATDALRRALDAPAVVRAVERELRLALHVLLPAEEALLTLLGATGAQPLGAQIAVVDVGGGSTEIILAGGGRGPHATTVPAGAARLADGVALADPPRSDQVDELAAAARRAIHGVPDGRPIELLAVGGTADNVLRIAPDEALGNVITRQRLAVAMTALRSEPADALAARTGIRPRRARLLPAGIAILGALLDRYALDALRVSAAGLRDGLILATEHAGAGWRDALPRLASGRR